MVMSSEQEELEFLEWKPNGSIKENLKSDWNANRSTLKGRLLVFCFRLASWFLRGRIMQYVGFPYLVVYRIAVEWVLGVEIPPLTRIGSGFAIHHGQGIVVNNRVVIGDNCLIRQGVTLGNRSDKDPYGCPIIENNVNIGANALVLGRVSIGDGAVIGAGAVVTRNVDAGDTVVGNPARSINKESA